MIVDNYRSGRKRSIWCSVNPDLKVDALRDMSDLFYGESKKQIPIFEAPALVNSIDRNSGCLFCTYKLIIGSKVIDGVRRSRIDQIMEWLGEDFDGLVSLQPVVLKWVLLISML